MSRQGPDGLSTQTRKKSDGSDAFVTIRWARRQRQIPNKVAKNVLIVLATYANPDGTGAWPSQTELAADTGFSVRAVRGAIAWLEDEKYLTRTERRRRDGSRSTDAYVLAIDRPGDQRHALPLVETEATGTAPPDKRHPTTDQPAPDSGLTPFDQPDYLPKDDSSEPVGSGPGAPAPGRKIVFEQGRISLGALGIARRTARDVIARWLRDTDDDTGRVLAAIQRATERQPRSPIPFITACLEMRTRHVPTERNADQREAFGDATAWLRKLEAARNCHP